MNENIKNWIIAVLILGIIAAGFVFQDYHAHIIKGANYSIYTNLYTTQHVLIGYKEKLAEYEKQEISDEEFKAILSETEFFLTKNACMTNKYGRHFGGKYDYVSLGDLGLYISFLSCTEFTTEELKYHKENLMKICRLWAPLTFHLTEDYSEPGASLKKAIEETERFSAEGNARIDEYLAMPEELRGLWKGAENSEGNAFYTKYIKMEITDDSIHAFDEEAGNPGFDAKITDVDDKYIYINLVESEDEPADWKLKAKDKIEYELYSKDELHLTHDATTCIFFRAQELTDTQIKVLDRLANVEWNSEDGSNLGISFSYFDLELYDTTKAAETRSYFTGRTYLNEEESVVSVIPDRTMPVGQNSIWPGIEQTKEADMTYELSEDGETLKVNYQGEEITFKQHKTEEENEI